MIREISLMTPKGILLNLELLDIQKEENAVTCAVQKGCRRRSGYYKRDSGVCYGGKAGRRSH